MEIIAEEPEPAINEEPPQQEAEWAMDWAAGSLSLFRIEFIISKKGITGNDMDMGMVADDVGGQRHSSEV